MIDVGTMAGTGKTAQLGAAHTGVQGAAVVDEGAFRESLKASVGGALDVPGVVPAAVAGGKAAGTPLPVSPVAARMRAALLSRDVTGAATPVVGMAGDAAKASVEASVAAGAAPAKVQAEDLEVAVPARAAGFAGTGTVVAGEAAFVESAAQVKPVADGKELTRGVESKGLKVDGGTAGKKVAGKGVEAGAGAVPELVSAAADTSCAVPVAVQAVAIAASPVGATTSEVQVQAATAGVGGSGKGAKVGGVSGSARGSGREAKKIDGQVQVAAKAEPGVGSAVAAPVVGSGAGHVAIKEGAVPGVAQGMAGAAAVAPVGVVASHGGIAGMAGAKVAAGVEVSSSSAGQGASQGPEVKTLAATPNLLEVGIDGGTHGWLRVRAELGQTGEVTASMVATSAGQADTLRRELPAMSTYLAGESVGVSSLVVNAAGAAAGAQDAAMSLGAGAQGGADGGAQQGAAAAQGGGSGGGARSSEDAGLEFSREELPAAVYANGSGSWLSVRV